MRLRDTTLLNPEGTEKVGVIHHQMTRISPEIQQNLFYFIIINSIVFIVVIKRHTIFELLDTIREIMNWNGD